MASIENGMIDYRYVVITFEECDITERMENEVVDYLVENNLLQSATFDAAEWLRDYYCYDTDPFYDAIEYALENAIGKEKLDELNKAAEERWYDEYMRRKQA